MSRGKGVVDQSCALEFAQHLEIVHHTAVEEHQVYFLAGCIDGGGHFGRSHARLVLDVVVVQHTAASRCLCSSLALVIVSGDAICSSVVAES